MGTIFAFGAPTSDPVGAVGKLPPHVTGVSWVFGWRDVEPADGQYSFAKIEACLAAAHAAGKTSMLRVDAGEKAPQWALTKFPSVSFLLTPHGPQPPHQVQMCIPVNANFLAAWAQWYAEFGLEYDGDPRISIVQVPGLGHIGELPLGDWSGWQSTAPPPNGCGADGPITTQKLIDGWAQIINAAHAAFSRTLIAVDA